MLYDGVQARDICGLVVSLFRVEWMSTWKMCGAIDQRADFANLSAILCWNISLSFLVFNI